jgi:4-amino-4-deoxy-L-arabinose transferase-like glycosyltransferase
MKRSLLDRLNGVESARRGIVLLILLVAFSSIALTGLNGSLQNVDEVFYARIARETLEKGSWLVQYKDGAAWIHKPPMIWWAVMLSYRLFGISDFAAKLPSAIAGIVSAFLLVFISRVLFQSLRAGIISGFLYLVSLQVYTSTHQVAADSILVMYLLASLYFTLKGIQGNPRWMYAAGFFNGLVILTKSPLGLVVPAALAVYIVIERRWALIYRFVLFFLISLVVSIPYFLYVYRKIPDIFVSTFLHEDMIDRFYRANRTNPLQLLNRLGYGFAFYALFLLLFTLPFTAGLFFVFARRGAPASARAVLWGKTSRLVSIYFLLTLTGFSLLARKWPHWSMPMIPAVVLFLGYTLHSIDERKIFLYSAVVDAAALALLSAVVILKGSMYPTYGDVFAGLIVVHAGFIAVNLVLFFKGVRAARGMFPLVIGFFICYTVFGAITVPDDFNRDIKSFSEVVYGEPSPLIVIGSKKVNEGSKKTVTVWYMRMWSENYPSLGDFLKVAPEVKSGTYLIFNRDYTDDLQELFPSFSVLKMGVIWNIGRVEETDENRGDVGPPRERINGR